jgi:serine/threonine protein kinase
MPDDYVIGAVMGDGLAGPRFAGRYRPSGHAVALEEIPHELLNRPDFVERLAISGRRAASLSAPHVVQVYDLVRVAHRLYLVTELCRGRTLAALVAAQPLPLRAALTVGDAVLAGIAEIHEAGLVHGDIRPEVVVVTPTGDVRLTELGLAAVLAADPSMRGSPAVHAPDGGPPSTTADVYAAACLLRDLVDAAPSEPDATPAQLRALITRAVSPRAEEGMRKASALRQELEAMAVEHFGSEWPANADLAARVSRPIGPPPSRALGEKGVVFPAPNAGESEPRAAAAVSAAAAPPVVTAPREKQDPGTPPPPPPPPAAPAFAAGAGSDGPDWPTQHQPPARPKGKAEPPLPWSSRRRRRRRLAVAGLIVVVLVAVVALILVAENPAGTPAGSAKGLAVGTPIRLTVLPAATGSCNTTFTVVATGPLSGQGTLVYRWEEAESGSTPIYQQYQLPISGDSSFRFTRELSFTGAATLHTTVTFAVVAPQRRSASTTVSYVCTH